MFSGIIEHTGKILEIHSKPHGIAFKIATQFSDCVLGESIAVDGVCLTVVAMTENSFDCEISPETLSLTTLGTLTTESSVNLERALRLSDRLGGHFVTGHVDQFIKVSHIENQGEYRVIEFSDIKNPFNAYLIPKGSIAINGVSLTVNQVTDQGFNVTLIPHTLERTNLKDLKEGSLVNVEYDFLTKTIYKQISLIRESLL